MQSRIRFGLLLGLVVSATVILLSALKTQANIVHAKCVQSTVNCWQLENTQAILSCTTNNGPDGGEPTTQEACEPHDCTRCTGLFETTPKVCTYLGLSSHWQCDVNPLGSLEHDCGDIRQFHCQWNATAKDCFCPPYPSINGEWLAECEMVQCEGSTWVP